MVLDLLGMGLGFPLGTAWIACTLLAAVPAVARFAGVRWTASDLGWRGTAPRSALGWAILALIGWYVLAVGYVAAVDPPASVDAFIEHRDATTFTVVSMGLVGVVLVPVAEETVFRGVIYGGLRSSCPAPVAALVSASLFGLNHWSLGLGGASLLDVPELVIFGLVTVVGLLAIAVCLLAPWLVRWRVPAGTG